MQQGSPYLEQPIRGLAEYRDELVRRVNRLAFTDPRRAGLADRIRQVEAAIDRIPIGG